MADGTDTTSNGMQVTPRRIGERHYGDQETNIPLFDKVV